MKLSIKNASERVQRLEAVRGDSLQSRFPDNSDNFVSALGVNPKDFEVRSGEYCGFDYLRALESIAINDWEEKEQTK